MSLETILEKINKEKVSANKNINELDPRVRTYAAGKIRAAKDRLDGLYLDYRNELLNRAIFILVSGENCDKFAEIARDFNCFTLDAEILAKEVVEKVNPQLYLGKKLNSNTFEVVNNILEEKIKKLDVVSYPSITFSQKYSRVVGDKKEMIDTVKKAINDTVGGEIVGVDALNRVSEEAIDKNYKSRLVPILLYSNDNSFINQLSKDFNYIKYRTQNITTEEFEEIDSDAVEKTLRKIAANA
jgi:hypothetical protein